MAQTFQYPNLLSGTRSGSGWGISVPGCADRPVIANRKAYKWAPVLDLQNSTSVENLLLSPPVTLHKDVDYTLSFVAAGTKNLAGLDVHVLDVDRSYDGWYVAGMYKQRPDGGGAGIPCISASRRIRTTERRTKSASTTTAAWTARTQSCGSRTSCSWRARSLTRGHRRVGRCGRR